MKKPTLVCINNSKNSVTRYISKPTGGFFTEKFDVIDREQFNNACTKETIEALRLGHLADQEYPENLPERA
jgi:hypothetical protein